MSTLMWSSTMTQSSTRRNHIGRTGHTAARMSSLNGHSATFNGYTQNTSGSGSFIAERGASPDYVNRQTYSIPTDGPVKIRFELPSQLLTWEDFKLAIAADKLTLTKETKRSLKKCILEGIPDDDRPILWKFLTGASLKLKINKGYYQGLLRCLDRVSSGKAAKSFDQIEKDLPRTFPDEREYSNPDFLQSLRNILRAYAIRNTKIGYCQGMNFIAGRLFQCTGSEEISFWILCQLLETVLPLDYFASMSDAIADQEVFKHKIEEFYPDLSLFFAELGIEFTSVVSFKWFVTLYTQSFSKEACFKIWDLLFLEGSIFLFKMGLALLELLEEQIFAVEDLGQFYRMMQQLDTHSHQLNTEELIKTATQKKYKLVKHNLEKLREKCRKENIERLSSSQQARVATCFVSTQVSKFSILDDYFADVSPDGPLYGTHSIDEYEEKYASEIINLDISSSGASFRPKRLTKPHRTLSKRDEFYIEQKEPLEKMMGQKTIEWKFSNLFPIFKSKIQRKCESIRSNNSKRNFLNPNLERESRDGKIFKKLLLGLGDWKFEFEKEDRADSREDQESRNANGVTAFEESNEDSDPQDLRTSVVLSWYYHTANKQEPLRNQGQEALQKRLVGEQIWKKSTYG